MDDVIPDQNLILGLQNGDLESLGELYDRYQRLVYRTALAITGDTDAAADLLQDVFLRLHRFADHVDPARPIEPWLYRMTANLAYSWVKRNNRWLRPLEEFSDWLVSGGRNSPSELVEDHDEWQQVQKAVLALPLAQRLVVVMYYINDLPLQEISDILEIPVGTVKSRLHYGRRALQKRLGLSGAELPDLNYEHP